MFPEPAWYPDEDRVAFPLAGALAVIGAVIALARPRRIAPERAGPLRAYAVVVLAAVLLHTAMIKWQPWGNRLLLYAVVLGRAARRALAGRALPLRQHRGRRGASDGRGHRGGGHRAGHLGAGRGARTVVRLPAPAGRRRLGLHHLGLGHPVPAPPAVGRRVPLGGRRRSATAARGGSGWCSRTTTGSTRGGCCCGSRTAVAGPGGVAVGAAGTAAGRPHLGGRDRLHRQPSRPAPSWSRPAGGWSSAATSATPCRPAAEPARALLTGPRRRRRGARIVRSGRFGSPRARIRDAFTSVDPHVTVW